MDRIVDLQKVFSKEKYSSLTDLLLSLKNLFSDKNYMNNYNEDGVREHEINLKYKGLRKYVITSVNLPHSPYQDKVYNSINEILHIFRDHVNSLSNYFRELERIDQFCSVVEPLKPTFKDDYRKIYLDNRTWLHVNVTPDGKVTNIYLIGHSEFWHDKLQSGLLTWDHDKDIVDNIMIIFDLSNLSSAVHEVNPPKYDISSEEDKQICGICLCNELPDYPGVPQPLCQNTACGVFFHRSCLYEWLVACTGGRPPTFGVATGSCPTCFHPIACSEKED
ncbi:unnamed protein product [Parnassius apollo]|uniref:(apollo) hypothetical protein n=1 Tax=Parnassius apollo TaxID=110799 RepID=A0A8S3XI06_PARAO|nr:unnamed protein product [Parnassius apollo]